VYISVCLVSSTVCYTLNKYYYYFTILFLLRQNDRFCDVRRVPLVMPRYLLLPSKCNNFRIGGTPRSDTRRPRAQVRGHQHRRGDKIPTRRPTAAATTSVADVEVKERGREPLRQRTRLFAGCGAVTRR